MSDNLRCEFCDGVVSGAKFQWDVLLYDLNEWYEWIVDPFTQYTVGHTIGSIGMVIAFALLILLILVILKRFLASFKS